MLQKTFSAEQREPTLASLWSARGYTVQNGGLSMKRTIAPAVTAQNDEFKYQFSNSSLRSLNVKT